MILVSAIGEYADPGALNILLITVWSVTSAIHIWLWRRQSRDILYISIMKRAAMMIDYVGPGHPDRDFHVAVFALAHKQYFHTFPPGLDDN